MITPYIIGSGRSSQAMKESLAVAGLMDPRLEIAPPKQLVRGEALPRVKRGDGSMLCICHPHGLHAPTILDAVEKGFDLVVTEKPACVSLEQAKALRSVKGRVVVCHVYRQTWGLQTLKEMISRGDLGQIITIEGRYWQSSAAQRAVGQKKGGGWKNDIALSGPSDTLLDVGVHWADAAVYLMGERLKKSTLWLSHVNAEAPHRDTHVQLAMDFEKGGRAMASISKTLHGATNHFEINVLGSQQAVTWNFMNPDQLEVGRGAHKTLVSRTDSRQGSGHPPFHGLGWIEGYVEILLRAMGALHEGGFAEDLPGLSEHLDIVESLLKAQAAIA